MISVLLSDLLHHAIYGMLRIYLMGNIGYEENLFIHVYILRIPQPSLSRDSILGIPSSSKALPYYLCVLELI